MTIIRNVRIWDGVEDDVDGGVDAIRIESGRIVELGASGDFARKASVDMGGATIVPGLIDAHVHLCLDPEETDPLAHGRRADEDLLAQMSARAEAMAKAGITTARDLGGGRWLELEIRDRIARGELPGPRLLCAGQPITSPEGHCHFWGGEAANAEEALAVLARQVERGVDLIKVMATGGAMTPKSKPVDAQFDEATMAAITAAAADSGCAVAAHCHGTAGIRHAAAAGVSTIEHCSWVGDGWGSAYDETTARAIAAGRIYVSPTVNAGWQRRIGSDWERRMRDNFLAMKSLGVEFIASTDAGIPNVYHDGLPTALDVFAHYADLTPVEVLRTATSTSAKAIGLGEVCGRVAPGMAADLLVVDGDPLADRRVLTSPVEVLCRGRGMHGLLI